MFKDKLYNILNDLSHYHRDKGTLMEIHISNRLNKSLQSYSKDLNDSCNYIRNRNELRTITILSRRK